MGKVVGPETAFGKIDGASDHGKEKAQSRHPRLGNVKKKDTRGFARETRGGFRKHKRGHDDKGHPDG